MRRRTPVEPATGLPTKLAAGPHIPTWADPQALDQIDLAPENEQSDLVMAAMLTARRNWRTALHTWADRHGQDWRTLPLQHRRPYW